MTTELSTDFLAAMPDVLARLESIRHPRVAELNCGRGVSTLAIASALLDAHVDGVDADAGAIADARDRAADIGVDGRVRFLHGDAAALAAHGPYDLVVILAAPYDAGTLRAVRAALAAGGTVLVVEDKIADTVRDLAAQAGYARADALPLDHDALRLYRLAP